MRALLVLVCLALVGCGSAQTGSMRIDPVLAAMVPQDTLLLAGIRMEDLRTTALYQRWAAGKAAPQLDDLARRTGFDLRKDLRELLIVSNGKDTLILARGKFLGAAPPALGAEQATVEFLNSTTAVAGRPAAVRAIIDRRGGSGGPPLVLREQIRAIPAGNQIWSAAAGGFADLAKAVPQSGNMVNIAKVLSMIDSFTAAADLRAGLKMFASGQCRNDQDAKSLGDAVRGLVGLGRLSTPDNQPDLLRVYDGIQVEQQQRTVRVNVSLSEQLLDRLMEQLARMEH